MGRMNIAVISDIHENMHNLVLFLREAEERGVEQIIMLGDMINAGIGKALAHSPIPVYGIWGNNDGDKVAITKASLAEGSNLTMGFATFDMLEFDGRKLFITHYSMLAFPMARSGDFDAVLYGHNHDKSIEHVGECLVANPGELGAHKTGEASYLLYNTQDNSAELMTLHGSITLRSDVVAHHQKTTDFTLTPSRGHMK